MERKDFTFTFDYEDSIGQLSDGEVETNGTVDQANVAAAIHGDLGMKITFDGSGFAVYAQDLGGTDVAEWVSRIYLIIDSNIGSLDASAIYNIAAVYDAGITAVVGLYIVTDGSGNPYGWYLADSGGLVAFELTYPTDTVFYVDIYWKDAVAGKLEGKINGVAFGSQGAGDNSAMPSTGDTLLLGAVPGGQTNFPANTEFIYIDDYVLVAGSIPIGEYSIPWDRRHM